MQTGYTMAMLPCVSLLCFMVFGPPGVALSGPAALKPARTPVPSIQGYGRANASCRAWTDGCTICQANGGGAAACSTPGIACTPGPVACRDP